MQDLSTTFFYNELTLSSYIPIYQSSQSPFTGTSIPITPLLENNHPMMARAKTGESKHKVF